MIHNLFPTAVYMEKDLSQIDLSLDLFNQAGPYFAKAESGFETTLENYSPATCSVSWDPIPLKKTRPFLDFVKQHVSRFLSEGRYKNYDITVANMWFNKMTSGLNHPMHTHYGYSLSGTYYVAVPGTSGKIMFHSPYDGAYHQKLDTEEFHPHNSYTWWMGTEVGTIALFPSYLRHSVPAEQFDGTRLSIAFDIILRPIKQLVATASTSTTA